MAILQVHNLHMRHNFSAVRCTRFSMYRDWNNYPLLCSVVVHDTDELNWKCVITSNNINTYMDVVFPCAHGGQIIKPMNCVLPTIVIIISFYLPNTLTCFCHNIHSHDSAPLHQNHTIALRYYWYVVQRIAKCGTPDTNFILGKCFMSTDPHPHWKTSHIDTAHIYLPGN